MTRLQKAIENAKAELIRQNPRLVNKEYRLSLSTFEKQWIVDMLSMIADQYLEYPEELRAL